MERGVCNGTSVQPMISTRRNRDSSLRAGDACLHRPHSRAFPKMSYRITIKPSNHAFDAQPDDTVLEAALREGYVLAYSWRNGACGTCKGKVLEGSVDYGVYQADTLPENRQAARPRALLPGETALGPDDRVPRDQRGKDIRCAPCVPRAGEEKLAPTSSHSAEAAGKRAPAIPRRPVHRHLMRGGMRRSCRWRTHPKTMPCSS